MAICIDGATDIDTLIKAMVLAVTGEDESKRQRFVKAVLDLGAHMALAKYSKSL